jgi:hypothetical protein
LTAGQTISGVLNDIDGQPRVAPYDIGADEVTINNLLAATTTGGGAGDLFLSLTLVDPAATEGWCLVSGDTSHPIGAGPFFGLWPDAFTWSLIAASR